jgi:hypothetical protein
MRAEPFEAKLPALRQAQLELSVPGGQTQPALPCDMLAGSDPGDLIGVSTNHDDR